MWSNDWNKPSIACWNWHHCDRAAALIGFVELAHARVLPGRSHIEDHARHAFCCIITILICFDICFEGWLCLYSSKAEAQ